MAHQALVDIPKRTSARTLSLADVAALADVRREVVSVWRTRSAGTMHPFPDAGSVASDGSQRFDAQAISAWLVNTGRGNNPDAAREVVLHADIDLIDGAAGAGTRSLDGVLALLALQAMCGELPTDPDDVLDLADEMDPDDELLQGELIACAGELPALVPLAVELSEAAYGPMHAAERVLARRARSAGSQRRTELTVGGVNLLRDVIRALVHRRPGAVVGDATGTAVPVIQDLASELVLGSDSVVTGPALRQARRVLVTRGASWRTAVAPTVALLGLPSADHPAMSTVQMLQTITTHHASCDRNTVTLVWGPASVLTDSLVRADRRMTQDDEAALALRSRLISSGDVRAIVRLPAGLRPSRSRERSALWCLGPTDERTLERRPRTIVGDLGEHELSTAVVSGLVSDLVASLDGSRGLRSRLLETTAIAYSMRLTELPGSLVTTVRAGGSARAAAVIRDRYLDAVEAVHIGRLGTIVLPRLSVREQPIDAVHRSIDQLRRDGMVGYVAGLRIDNATETNSGGVTVFDARLGAGVVAALDRLDLNLRHPNLKYTEPGDVVFCTSDRPRAFVDRHGGAVVRHPSRALRSRDPRLVPEVMAAAINARPAGETAWRAWTVALVESDDADLLRAGAAALEAERRRLQEQLRLVGIAETALLDLATGGAIQLLPPSVVDPEPTVEPDLESPDARPETRTAAPSTEEN